MAPRIRCSVTSTSTGILHGYFAFTISPSSGARTAGLLPRHAPHLLLVGPSLSWRAVVGPLPARRRPLVGLVEGSRHPLCPPGALVPGPSHDVNRPFPHRYEVSR